MPNITIDGPILDDLDVKRILMKEITESIVKAYNIPKEHIIVVIKENSPNNVSVGGTLISDRKKG